MLKRNSELHLNDLICKSCLRNLQIKVSRIAQLKSELYYQIASEGFTHAVKSPKFFACGGLSALASLVPAPCERGALRTPSPIFFACGGLSALASLVPGPRKRRALRAPCSPNDPASQALLGKKSANRHFLAFSKPDEYCKCKIPEIRGKISLKVKFSFCGSLGKQVFRLELCFIMPK